MAASLSLWQTHSKLGNYFFPSEPHILGEESNQQQLPLKQATATLLNVLDYKYRKNSWMVAALPTLCTARIPILVRQRQLGSSGGQCKAYEIIHIGGRFSERDTNSYGISMELVTAGRQ